VAENVIGKTEVLAYLTINPASICKPNLAQLIIIGIVSAFANQT